MAYGTLRSRCDRRLSGYTVASHSDLPSADRPDWANAGRSPGRASCPAQLSPGASSTNCDRCRTLPGLTAYRVSVSAGPSASGRPFRPEAGRSPKAPPAGCNRRLLRHSPPLAARPGTREELRHGAPRRTGESPLLSSRQVSGGEGYPSETKVRRGLRVVYGDRELAEKLGRNDLCPCGSAKRLQ